MSSPVIYDFQIDDENVAKFEAHGLRARAVLQVLGRGYLLVKNRSGKRAKYLIVGRDEGGDCVCVPIEATTDPVIWRPITAWRCKVGERTKLENAGL